MQITLTEVDDMVNLASYGGSVHQDVLGEIWHMKPMEYKHGLNSICNFRESTITIVVYVYTYTLGPGSQGLYLCSKEIMPWNYL